MRTVELEVTNIQTGEVVHTIDVRKQTESGVERVIIGLLTNMDTDRYCVNEVEGDD